METHLAEPAMEEALDRPTSAEVRWKWRWEVAWLARGVIIAANRTESHRGRWPQKIHEWFRVAKRLGMDLAMIRAGQVDFGARLLDDTIFLQSASPEQLSRWIAHEVVEGVLRREVGLPPVCYPWEPCTDEHHIVAGLVEKWAEHPQITKRGEGAP